MKLTQTMKDALHEFDGKVDGYVCRFKPKTMAKLEELGFTKAATQFGKVVGYRITDYGKAALSALSN